MHRLLYDADHEEFRRAFRSFLMAEATPHVASWEEAGRVDPAFVKAAGSAGYLGFEVPVEHGGLGLSDFRYNAVMAEEVVHSGMAGDLFSMLNDIALPYLLELTTSEQRERWLPGIVKGETVVALAMTEPGAGSDLAAIRTSGATEGDQLVVTGSKTFITNGATCDLAIVLVRTGELDGRGMSLVVVEHPTDGFTRGRPLRKVGRRAQDTAELSFDACRVPLENLIGEPGGGLAAIKERLPQERLSIATTAVASAERGLSLALEHARDREAFGGRLGDLQSVRMALAEMATDIAFGRSHLDACIAAHLRGDLTADEAAGVKYWTTELEFRTLDRCMQLFGGYGYMEEYPIARMWRDARVTRIYGGANEVMKDVIGRHLVGRP